MSRTADILVIDDEQIVREGVCRVCEAGGLSIEAVGDAASGLERLQQGQYRLVLCDVMLPEQDGFHVLHEMKRAGINTPVVMITGCSTLQNAVNAMKEGALDFIPKPFTVDELEGGIQRGLRYQKLVAAASTSGPLETMVPILSRPCLGEYSRLGNLSWAKIEQNGIALVGVTDLFMKVISPVESLKLIDVNQDLVQATSCGTIASRDALFHEILCPLSGRIVARNEELTTRPELLEQDPYSAGWLYQIVPTNLAFELNQLIPCSYVH